MHANPPVDIRPPRADASQPAVRRKILRLLLNGGICTLLLAVFLAFTLSRFTVNTTSSLPRGFYFMPPGNSFHRGDLVTFPVPVSLRSLVVDRAYLPSSYRLLKRIVAVPGDSACLTSGSFLVNDQLISVVASADSAGRPLPPPFPFCGVVPSGSAIVATPPSSSFDSRYFGPLRFSTLTHAVPVWTY